MKQRLQSLRKKVLNKLFKIISKLIILKFSLQQKSIKRKLTVIEKDDILTLRKNDITLFQYMQIQLALETFKDEPEKLYKEVVRIVYNDFSIPKNHMDEKLSKLYESFKEESYLVNRVFFNNKEWGFIPDLENMSSAEFIDLDEYLKQSPMPLHKIASILYRPITEKSGKLYKIENYEGTHKYSEELKDISYKVITGALVFFCNLKMILKTENV